MADIKKLIEEKIRQPSDELDNNRPFTPSNEDSITNSWNLDKANRLLRFADSVLREFALQIKAVCEHKGSNFRETTCLAWYQIYRTGFLGLKKGPIILEVAIGIKYYGHNPSTTVLEVNKRTYGNDVYNIDTKIDEEWFINIGSIVVKHVLTSAKLLTCKG